MHKASTDTDKGTLQGVTQGWLSLTAACPPASALSPTSSLFLDNFLDELEKLSALTFSPDQAKPNIPEEITLEITEEPTVLLSLPPASVSADSPHFQLPFPCTSVTSATAQSYQAVPKDPMKTTQTKSADSKRMRRAFSDPEKVPDILGDKFVASAHTNVGSLPIPLPVIGEEDEELYEGIVSGIRKRVPEHPEQEALWCGHDGTEVTPSLHIDEEEEDTPSRLRYPVAIPTGPRIPQEDSSVAKTSNEVFEFA